MPESDRERGGGPEIATGTLAEIYAQQGLYDRALEIYRRIAQRSPADDRVAARIAELERTMAAGEEGAGAGPPGAPPAESRADRPARPAVADPAPEAGSDPPEPQRAPSPPAAEDEAFLRWLSRR
jgi:hypothetical protein